MSVGHSSHPARNFLSNFGCPCEPIFCSISTWSIPNVTSHFEELTGSTNVKYSFVLERRDYLLIVICSRWIVGNYCIVPCNIPHYRCRVVQLLVDYRNPMRSQCVCVSASDLVGFPPILCIVVVVLRHCCWHYSITGVLCKAVVVQLVPVCIPVQVEVEVEVVVP